MVATKSALKVLAEDLRQRAHKIAKAKADAEAAAAALDGVALTIAAKTSENGTIFGSVGALQISEALAKLGHEIDRKLITVSTIKSLGSYSYTVRFHKEVAVELPLNVVAEGEEKSAEAEAAAE